MREDVAVICRTIAYELIRRSAKMKMNIEIHRVE
jgi:hypothetical protein